MLTAQILQDKVQFPPRLEGIDEVHDERMLYLLQNAPLSFSVRRVLCITHNHGLERDKRKAQRVRVRNYSGNNLNPISFGISQCQSFNFSCRGRARITTPGW